MVISGFLVMHRAPSQLRFDFVKVCPSIRVSKSSDTGSDEQQIELPGAQAISLGVLDGSTYTTSHYSGQVTFQSMEALHQQ